MARIAILHADWLEHAEVGVDEIAVLAVLALHADRSGVCFPSQGHLARLLGKSRPWVCKVIGTLVDLGLVIKAQRHRDDGGVRACLYHLVAPPAARIAAPATLHQGHDAVVDERRDRGPVDPPFDVPPNKPSQPHDRACQKTDMPRQTHDTIKKPSEHKRGTLPVGGTTIFDPVGGTTTFYDEFENSNALNVPGEDWQPTEKDQLWALEHYPDEDVRKITARFVNRCRAKGYRYRDLSAAWRSWLIDDRKAKTARRDGSSPSSYARFNVWASVAGAATVARSTGCRHGA